jgi:competence protein ComEC
MPKYGIPIWKAMPLLRMLLPLMAGILLQYYCQIPIWYCIIPAIAGCCLLLVYLRLSNSLKFVTSWFTGVAITLCFISIGGCISYQKNIENQSNWIGKYYVDKAPVLVTLQEPLIEKAKSYKALASAEVVFSNGIGHRVSGNLLVYFKKDTMRPSLDYGSQIIIYKSLQPITNSGNPGAFNYHQYCYFQNISYQVFITPADYHLLTSTHTLFFDKWLIKARMGALSILRQNIKNVESLGLAEALLIGYRDDLDKTLVQAYSNTGVVHIIAISGLHLALIYGLLITLLRPFQRFRFFGLIKPLVILSVLWGFSFIAGAAPSILRCTVMFTFIVLGETLNKRSNIYNNLAASAFTILLFSPFSLWDVGFQLSYAAVFSIVLFEKHIQNSLYFTNKLLKKAWELISITLSAQILKLPIILYYFHQFPTLFLFTNLFAVPLSGLILYEELFLLVVSPLAIAGKITGAVTGWCIGLMDDLIKRVDGLPLLTLQSLQISLLQTLLLYIVIAGMAWWLLQKQNKGLILAFTGLLAFFVIRSIDFIECIQQQKLIVYNVPNHQAIDVVVGRSYKFSGDSILSEDGFLKKFHLTPSRILYRISPDQYTIPGQDQVLLSTRKKIILIDKPINTAVMGTKIKADLIIISKNPKISLGQLIEVFDCNEYIFDASNPLWKINKWKKECSNLHLHSYSIPERGAFVMEL